MSSPVVSAIANLKHVEIFSDGACLGNPGPNREAPNIFLGACGNKKSWPGDMQK